MRRLTANVSHACHTLSFSRHFHCRITCRDRVCSRYATTTSPCSVLVTSSACRRNVLTLRIICLCSKRRIRPRTTRRTNTRSPVPALQRANMSPNACRRHRRSARWVRCLSSRPTRTCSVHVTKCPLSVARPIRFRKRLTASLFHSRRTPAPAASRRPSLTRDHQEATLDCSAFFSCHLASPTTTRRQNRRPSTYPTHPHRTTATTRHWARRSIKAAPCRCRRRSHACADHRANIAATRARPVRRRNRAAASSNHASLASSR